MDDLNELHRIYDNLLRYKGIQIDYQNPENFKKQILNMFYAPEDIAPLQGDSLEGVFSFFFLNRDSLFNEEGDNSLQLQTDSNTNTPRENFIKEISQ